MYDHHSFDFKLKEDESGFYKSEWLQMSRTALLSKLVIVNMHDNTYNPIFEEIHDHYKTLDSSNLNVIIESLDENTYINFYSVKDKYDAMLSKVVNSDFECITSFPVTKN
jgi:hypothetical protein